MNQFAIKMTCAAALLAMSNAVVAELAGEEMPVVVAAELVPDESPDQRYANRADGGRAVGDVSLSTSFADDELLASGSSSSLPYRASNETPAIYRSAAQAAGAMAADDRPGASGDSYPHSTDLLESSAADDAAVQLKDETAAPQGEQLSLYLSEKILFMKFARSAERYGLDQSRAHLGFLLSEERDIVLQGGLSVDTALFEPTVGLALGTRAYIAILNQQNSDSIAIAIGAEGSYALPIGKTDLEFGASLYYAPDVVTFGSGDGVLDIQLDVALPIRSQLSVFAGWRFLQVDTQPGDEEIDNRLHIGLHWDFM